MSRLRQQVDFLEFGFTTSLPKLLELEPPPFQTRGEAWRQLEYVGRLARNLGCQSLLLERHYIDRHYIEDHSVFYSRSLYPYENYCRRLHFFSCAREDLERKIEEMRRSAREDSEEEHAALRSEFARSSYLGFCILKPLPGCPVGRTVLRPPESVLEPEIEARFPCVRAYGVHLSGLELTVRGLAFQQQDVGVSACATTAVWSSLQKLKDFEEVASATPAQITLLASRYRMPFGRSMPSEGLSLDQMCQAISALGASPNLFQAEDFETARSYLYSAISSELPPILILRGDQGQSYHAVVAVGMDVRREHQTSLIAEGFADDCAGDLFNLYLHDDRIGPYVKADIVKFNRGLSLEVEDERWELTHVLIPMHPKIRLSFSGLRNVAARLVEAVQAYRKTVFDASDPLLFDIRIVPSPLYLSRLLRAQRDVEVTRVERLWATVPLPRYVGVVQMESEGLDPLHFLVDCTSTERNVHPLAVLALRGGQPQTEYVTTFLSERYDCWPIDGPKEAALAVSDPEISEE